VRVRAASLAAGLVVAGALAGCVDPLSAARGTCQSQAVGEQRCRAIVADAGSRLPPDNPPITGVEVRLAGLEDRDTLRDQTLVAFVRFSFLDGSSEEVPVFCGPRLARTAACVETAP
jgi:hypothetical protein